ncbi:fluoride efflux transporter CrcB [Opitutales bacterium ASA1]|uniref:fluoride efflux transporter CrcB n=1 Tax=Congregicoccus parvus TaxID=3081749 RepID=UPI002B314F0B|nr:fluoride efflux transporter CrcB [Opitutales bacterium ASA1]
MRVFLYIALGSALGGVARHWISGMVAARVGETFPWGTFVVNALGSLSIGVLAGFADSGRIGLSAEARQFLMVGLLGGFTTFSSFSLQTLRLMQDGDWGRAAGNVMGSVLVCLVAVVIGWRIARLFG